MLLQKNDISAWVFLGYLALVLLVLKVADDAVALPVLIGLTILIAAYAVFRLMGYRNTTVVGLKAASLAGGLIWLIVHINGINVGTIMMIAIILGVVVWYFWGSFLAALDNEVPMVREIVTAEPEFVQKTPQTTPCWLCSYGPWLLVVILFGVGIFTPSLRWAITFLLTSGLIGTAQVIKERRQERTTNKGNLTKA